MEGLFEEGVEQFTFYEKDLTNRKTRNQKKFEKVQKLKHDMNDPEQKRIRHEIRRGQQKKKLKKQLDSMTQQQVKVFLDARKLKKKQAKDRIIQALIDGQQIFVDIVYEKRMNQKQNKSLAIQIELIMKSIRHLQNPPGIHLCSVGGVVETQLQKMYYHFWTLKSHKEDIAEVAKSIGKKLVYLSPDAPQALQSVESDTAYVIGGLVDRTVIKNLSLYRAYQLDIPVRHLPIKQMMKSRSCLNLDHVVMIICKFKQCGNWQQAFQFGAPKRWKREEGQKKTKNTQKQEFSEDEKEEELQINRDNQQIEKQQQLTQQQLLHEKVQEQEQKPIQKQTQKQQTKKKQK